MRRVWRHWPASLSLGGKFQLTGTPSLLDISGEGPLTPGGFSFKSQVQHRAGEWHYAVDLDLNGLRPQILAVGEGSWAARLKKLPPLGLQLRVQGAGLSWPPRNLECTLQGRPFTCQTAKVEHLRLTLKADGREQRLQGDLRGNFGVLSATLSGPLLSSRAGEVKIQAEGFRPELWGLTATANSLLSGKFSGKCQLPGALPAAPLALAGDLEARGQWGQQPLKDLRARLSLKGSRLEIAQAQVKLGTLAADLKGAVDPQGVDLQGKGSLTLDGTWPLLPKSLGGRVAGEGAWKGPWAAPQFTCQAQGQRLSWHDFAWEKVALKAGGRGWPPSAGSLEIQGQGLKTPVGVFAQAAGHSQGDGGKWRLRFTASSPQGLRAEIQGRADLLAQPRVLTFERCSLDTPRVSAMNTSPIHLRFQPGLELGPATWRVNAGRLTLRAQSQGEGLAARLEAVDLPASLLEFKGASLAGKIQGQLDLTGSLRHPAMEGQFTWGPGKWGDFPFRSLQTSLNYREGNLILKGSVEEKPSGPRLVWDGRIPLKLSFSPLGWDWGERDLDFRVQGENANLALLTALTPGVQSASGALNIKAQWQGDPRHPRVSGTIRWGEGTLQLRVAGPPFKLLPGEASLQGEKLVIPDIALESGGTAHIHGSITMAAFWPQKFDVRAQLQDFHGLGRGGAEAFGSGSVALTGPSSAPLLKGRLVVSKSSFHPGFFQTGIHQDIVLKKPPSPPGAKAPKAGEPALWKNMRMDITLDAPGDAWIIDKRLRVELAGTIKARKRPGEPTYMSGTLRALKGTYELQRRPFKIERAEIRFPGKPQGEATLEGRATYEIADITLILTASGPANKPQVKMESIPPLSPPDMLAYLMFGRPAQTLTREEYLTVGQQALGILGGVTAQKIQEILGKDFPLVGNVSLQSGQSEGRQTMGIAKPITKDLTVTFERKTSPLYRDDTNQVRLEYKVNKYFSVESQVGRRNSGGDVLFNLDF